MVLGGDFRRTDAAMQTYAAIAVAVKTQSLERPSVKQAIDWCLQRATVVSVTERMVEEKPDFKPFICLAPAEDML